MKENKTKKIIPKKDDEGNITSKIRKNPFIVTTIVLCIFCIFVVIGNVIESKNIDKTENEILCSVIFATPAWASNGKIISYGVIIPKNESIDFVNEFLIPERTKFLYNPHCSACEAQIDYFKEQGTWEAYQNEGLTVSCN